MPRKSSAPAPEVSATAAAESAPLEEFHVSMPITGSVTRTVKAASKQAAVKAFWDSIDEQPATEDEIQWEYTEKVTSGNVCHAMQNEVSVTKARKRQTPEG